MTNGHSGGEPRVQGILFRLVGHHDHALGALGHHLAGDLRHRQRAIDALAAGHRDRVVVEDLEGDVDAGRDRSPDPKAAGVEIGAVAQVLEHVGARRERRLADPVGALAAHLGVAQIGAVHPLGHVVAADPGARDAAIRHAGRGVVGTAGAEIRRAQDRAGELLLGVVAPAQLRKMGHHRIARIEPEDALRQRESHLIARERAMRGKQGCALLVVLADDHRRVRLPVQQLFQLRLDQGALLLDHDDLLEAGREAPHAFALERPDQAELEHAQAKPGGHLAVDAEIGERLAQVQVRLAGRDDAEPRMRAVEHHAVEARWCGRTRAPPPA